MRRRVYARLARRVARKSERFTYLVAAVMSSLGITSMAVMAVYYRFSWQMEVGMEFWARWAHGSLCGMLLCKHMHEGLEFTVFGMALHVHSRWTGSQEIPRGTHCKCTLFPEGRCSTSASSLRTSYSGVPYGLFLGPKELEEVGGLEELEKEVNRRIKISKPVNVPYSLAPVLCVWDSEVLGLYGRRQTWGK
ncbi:hypothetical protein HAX54_008477 [Datura stramonium]|uniref:beta-carotene 3-hydroxylase n=1 Tax=Datura stramonium TaxID=4076 RepID=A0ABS8TD93_DATST|nr:hypothetical protein [Datura stramonium]